MAYLNNDNRYLPRWETANKVVCQSEDTPQAFEGCTEDLSSSGTCIRMKKLPGLSRDMKITIYLADRTAVETEGRIVWIKHLKDGVQVGIKFSSLSEEDQDLILEHAFQIDKPKFLNQLFKGWNNHKF